MHNQFFKHLKFTKAGVAALTQNNMIQTAFTYFLIFLVFIGCLIGFQKWNVLEQSKKDKIGRIVLISFLTPIIGFLVLVFTHSNLLDGFDLVIIVIVLSFLFVVLLALFLYWYNQKYNRKVNIFIVVLILFSIGVGSTFVILNQSVNLEKQDIIKNLSFKATVKNIIFDKHKPYFKDMVLSTNEILPMPRAMNSTLQIGDSIYKNKNQNQYTVINHITHEKKVYIIKMN